MKRAAKIAGVLVALAVMLLTLRHRFPAPSDLLHALERADNRWLALAALAQFASMAAFSRQQRRLLIAFGVTVPRHRMLAVSYSRSALSISLPAGAAVSAGYAFRQFRAGGANRSAAMAVMVLSGLLSALGLVLLYAAGALAWGAPHLPGAWHAHPVLTAGGALAVPATLVLLVLAVRWLPRRLPGSRLLASLTGTLETARSVAARHWVLALGSAVTNWLTDLLCLVATARAFGLGTSLIALAAVYLTVQVVRQVPLTPGGIGVIEVSLLTGLVSAGAAESTGTATVLAYRMLSCWLIIPVGLLCWLLLHTRSKVEAHALLD
ncbi:YbhN family protein [Amycolatopsis cynarae]|uniref:YbhN family protein n=1 Tax=Amycolatopsis cynarae TaxID=2995223 RepID=A0ABY7AWL9_9PSEU|nr:YbhN family protein [Amycolatopsis sp. HUAS 11-8]WAL64412.1 YbhN family protein [Amycolatopsis sp. HUAS 11-8]